MFLVTFSFYIIFSSLLMLSTFFFYHFLYFHRTFFWPLFVGRSIVDKFLVFLHLWMYWVSLHSWWVNSLGIKFLVECTFWPPWCWMTNWLLLELFPPIAKVPFLSVRFQYFLFIFSFQKFDYIYIWVWISSLSYMGDVQLFLSVGLWFVPKLGRGLSHYYFQYFSEPLFLSSLLRIQKTLVLDLQVIVQKVPGLYSYFLQNIFSTLFRFYYFYCFIFKYTDCFLCLHHCVVEPIYWDFILVINFF